MEDLQSKSAKELAEIIKTTHRTLRHNSIHGDADAVWATHTRDAALLGRYAAAMHGLATRHWQEDTANCRMRWTYEAVQEYFSGGGLARARQKEARKLLYLLPGHVILPCEGGERKLLYLLPGHVILPCEGPSPCSERLRVLDVGSCYDPFSRYPDLDVTALDLHPATETVHQCDFLNLKVETNESSSQLSASNTVAMTNEASDNTVLQDITPQTPQIDQDSLDEPNKVERHEARVGAITSLPAMSFNVVIFCLFLEYIPVAEQRLRCCKIATELLKPEGILVIITPDSKYEGHNNFLYKAWQVALAELGLARIKYQKKEHFHGMVFRKGLCRQVWQQDSQRMLNEIQEKMTAVRQEKSQNRSRRAKQMMFLEAASICNGLVIPQDLKMNSSERSPAHRIEQHEISRSFEGKRTEMTTIENESESELISGLNGNNEKIITVNIEENEGEIPPILKKIITDHQVAEPEMTTSAPDTVTREATLTSGVAGTEKIELFNVNISEEADNLRNASVKRCENTCTSIKNSSFSTPDNAKKRKTDTDDGLQRP
ncbi:S-adenosylmethionine sensor upstream of mTORC1-like [Hyalella azteca]|uniref:S-adenosylmethionine sensor upstream of mTORC1 n=1 Tax=Hyalella azteca TaxID=294128 RepID=A0A979FIH4_HYAAZ|nr:S-adenosylmethionine sensor upstream of mTORC1-like [Hyalella azteca]